MALTRAVLLAGICIEMDAYVLIQQQMPWRMFEKKKHRTENTILSLNIK